jgi:hypothetical protein
MTRPKLTIWRVVGRKLSVIVLLAVSAAGTFAALGDGRKKSSSNAPKSLMSARTAAKPGYFSLKSGYTYRGNQVISTDKRYINLNTVVNIQKGRTTYIIPLKKKVLVSNIKIELGNRQFKRN